MLPPRSAPALKPEAQTLLQQAAQAQSRGDLVAAQSLLERALQGAPHSALLWRQFASVQEAGHNWLAAEQAWRRVSELQPDFIEAHYNRARMLRVLGDTPQALQALTHALAIARNAQTPHTLLAQMHQLLAMLQEQDGQLATAVATLDQALALAPQRAALHHNRAALLQQLGRFDEALAGHDRAMQLGLDVADAHYNRGNSLQSLGRTQAALTAYQAALQRDPQHALALFDIARLRWRLGEAHFFEELDVAATAAPQSALAPGIKGRLMLRAERFEAAAAAFSRAAALDAAAPGYVDGLGQALCRLGRLDEALAAHQRAVELAPADAATHMGLANCLLQRGQLGLAADVAEKAVRLAPLDQQAWATLGAAWRAAGYAHDGWLNNYPAHVRVYDLSAPEGYKDAASFNRALAEALTQWHTDKQAPIDQTLRHGSQTMGNVFDRADPLISALKFEITKTINSYIAYLNSLPQDDGHPLLGRTSAQWRFTDSWSSRLRSGGFHTNHVHPHGWISSCYYVAVPSTVANAPANSTAGWISFGKPDIAVPGGELTSQMTVQPQVGRLVLFPSFMWHGTVPFDDEAPRLTVAFDVVPV
jgi:tetratricopeptide (TPR) repeat protein